MQQRIPSVGLCVNNLKVPGRIKLVHQQSPKAFFDSFERVLNFEVVIVCIRAVCLCVYLLHENLCEYMGWEI